MTGLLARMAARATGEMPVAAPRIPTRFEPLPEELGLPQPAPAPHEAPVPPTLPSPAAIRPIPPSVAAPAPMPVPPTGMAAESVPLTPASMPAAASPAAIPAAPIATPAPAAAVQRRAAPAPHASGPPPAPADAPRPVAGEALPAVETARLPDEHARPRAAVRVGSTTIKPPVSPEMQPSPPDAAPSADPIYAENRLAPPAAALSDAVPPPPVAPAEQTATSLHDAPGPANRIVPIEATRPTDRAPTLPTHPAVPHAAPPPPAAAPPVVEIHIGSVEVRAAPLAAAPAAPSAPTSTSLDAFLAQGRGR